MIEIGNRIREIRERKGETLRLTAESIEVSHAHLSKIENGKNMPSVEVLDKLANHFDVPVGYFFGEEQSIEELKEKKVIEFINEIDLLDVADLMNKYDISMMGKEVTERELKMFISWMKTLREED